MTASDWTMQRLADLLDAPVDHPIVQETTALGAAYLAGLPAGVYPEPKKLADNWRLERRFKPAMSAATRERKLEGLGEGGERRARERRGRGTTNRHCEERATSNPAFCRGKKAGLLRFARNDGLGGGKNNNAGRNARMKKTPHPHIARRRALLHNWLPRPRQGPRGPPIASAARRTTTDVAGLKAPGQILVDVWGIPHIYADNEHDLFFLQGYNAARDRLWQIDLWRKRGLGLLAKDFGPAYVDQDRAARLFLYRGDMDAEWAAYGPKARPMPRPSSPASTPMSPRCRPGERPRPIEFKIAGTMPDLWTAGDVVRIRSHGLARNVASEVKRSLVACAAGLEADRAARQARAAMDDESPKASIPAACPKRAGGLRPRHAAGALSPRPRTRRRRCAHDPDTFLAEADQQRDTIGSNNWVVAPSRTATGRPILANDPHREHSVPSLRYIVGLTRRASP